MKKIILASCLFVALASPSYGEVNPSSLEGTSCGLTTNVKVDMPSGLLVNHHDGQSFISWKDRAEGEAGQAYRYNVYRSTTAITTDADLQNAELIAKSVFNNSGQLFGHGFRKPERIDPTNPMSIMEEGGSALPLWSGLWVANVRTTGCAFYAVISTDKDGNDAEAVQVGINTTTEAVAEQASILTPMKLYDADERDGPYVAYTRITDKPNLPLKVVLHASNAGGGGASDYGDYYLYFGNQSMGYQEGLPGVFSMEERRKSTTEPQHLMLRNRDTIVRPDAHQGLETYWFGYIAEPTYSGERFAYPFTESRLDWIIPWSISKYKADPNHIFAVGGSMGAWGNMTYAFRRSDVFKAIYPDRPRMRQRWVTSVFNGMTINDKATVTLPDGKSWSEHHDSIKYAQLHPEDLPFVGWNVGRHDGFATWQEQVDMVKAMSEERHGFAFAWNDGDHSVGSKTRHIIQDWYPPEKFALNQSYPAFSNSSIDDNLGNGDPADGDLEGGINLGFDWATAIDEPHKWEINISNALAVSEMTVDITPRRRQNFKPQAGEVLAYTDSEGSSGNIIVDNKGRITVLGLKIQPAASTTLTITSSSTSVNTDVTIPNVSGKTKETAQSDMEALGLQVTTSSENNDTVGAGMIIRTIPSSNSMVTSGSTVTLVVSLGKDSSGDGGGFKEGTASSAGSLGSLFLLMLGLVGLFSRRRMHKFKYSD